MSEAIDDWKVKRRGWSDIHTHPIVDGAIVDGRGFGLNPGVRHRGKDYESVAAAKRAALAPQVQP